MTLPTRKPRINEMLILGTLARYETWGQINPSGIARKKGFPQRQMAEAFRGLESRGMVEARRDPSGQFVRFSRITPLGRLLLEYWHVLIFGKKQD